MTEAARAVALVHQPVSRDYLDTLKRVSGIEPEIVVLTDLRRHSSWELWRRVRAIDADYGLVLADNASSVPLLPVMMTLLAFSRCERLGVADATGTVQPLQRLRAAAAAASIVRGTAAGVVAGLRSRLDLSRRRPVRRRQTGTIRRVGYLKTNLWLGVKAGGSVGHVAGVVNAMRARGLEVTMCAVDRPPLVEGVDLHEIGGPRHYGYPYELNHYASQQTFVREAVRRLRPRRPDVIYHRLSVGNYAGLLVAERLDVPLIVEYNGSEVWVARHWGHPLRFEDLAARAEHAPLVSADLVVVVSEPLRDELLSRGVDGERILVQPNAVDPAMFDPDRFDAASRSALRQRLGISERAMVCGFVGTFGQWHGGPVLADAIVRLHQSQPRWVTDSDVHFLLVGDGQYLPEVRRRIDEAGASRLVTFTGLVPQGDAPSYLAASDVLLSPHVANADGSRFFGSPTKLFEYMAMGRGIIASDLEQIGEILQPGLRAIEVAGRAGDTTDALAVLVTPGDSAELSRAIAALVERPDLAATIGANARRRALERHTWRRNVDEMIERLEWLSARA